MILYVDESWILEVAERAGHRDPAADDCGVPIAAVARHRGDLLDTPVYDGPYTRAAAVMYLEASNVPVNPTREQLTALAHELNNPGCTADWIASYCAPGNPDPGPGTAVVRFASPPPADAP